jgi:hypothetical protein
MTAPATTAPAAAPVAEKLPIQARVERHIRGGGDTDDLAAPSFLFDRLKCAEALCETIAPNLFSLEDKLEVAERLFAAKESLDGMDTSDLDNHAARPLEMRPDSPLGRWLTERTAARAGVPSGRAIAQDMAAARDVFTTLGWALDVGRSVWVGRKLTPANVLKIYDGLVDDTQRTEMLREQAEQAAGGAALAPA